MPATDTRSGAPFEGLTSGREDVAGSAGLFGLAGATEGTIVAAAGRTLLAAGGAFVAWTAAADNGALGRVAGIGTPVVGGGTFGGTAGSGRGEKATGAVVAASAFFSTLPGSLGAAAVPTVSAGVGVGVTAWTAEAAARVAAKVVARRAASGDFLSAWPGLWAGVLLAARSVSSINSPAALLAAEVSKRVARAGMTAESVRRRGVHDHSTIPHAAARRGLAVPLPFTIPPGRRVASGADGCRRQVRRPAHRGATGPLAPGSGNARSMCRSARRCGP